MNPFHFLNFSSRYSFKATALLNLFSFVPYSKVIDFCSPEAGAATYTDGEGSIRYGRIDIEKRPSMVRGVQMDYCTDEWIFRFSEANLRQ